VSRRAAGTEPPLPEAQRRDFLTRLFDETAASYDRMSGLMSLGSGAWYRANALRRAGLRPGMTILDVAVGTGAVARAAARILGRPEDILGLDPSPGMLAQAQRRLAIPLVQGVAERLPVRDGAFDFLSMGYALRHVSDLRATFAEYFRVLRGGGTLLVLDFARPRSELGLRLARAYFQRVLPSMVRLGGRGPEAARLWQYCWDTVERAPAAEAILEAMRGGGFRGTRRTTWLGLFSEYLGRKP
jgi:demethylmenaquinone methyltransferase/2-methoxy-6-polyprenyl-1,4-benzoquinol methylase